MMGKRFMFQDVKPHDGGVVAFVSICKGKIFGIGKIGIPSLAIDNVLYVEGLKYNQLSISQFFDSGYIVSFNKDKSIATIEDEKSFFTAIRHNNLYEIDLIDLSQ